MFDLVVYNGVVVNASTTIYPPVYIGVKDGKIACISKEKLEGEESVDAEGGIIMPGGVDSHCHIDQKEWLPDDTFETATRSAICGGTTTVCCFATQHKDEETVFPALEKYQAKAKDSSYCDYGMHMIISKAPPEFLEDQLPALVKQGITSVKMYMTYKLMKLSDSGILRLLVKSKELGVTAMIHAENAEMIDYVIDQCKKAGTMDPYFHAISRPPISEDEASYRAICLAKLAQQALLIVHMSTGSSLEHVHKAQAENYPIFAETCPQYLFLTSEYLKAHSCVHDHNQITLDQEDPFCGAKYICSPPLRSSQSDLSTVWKYLQNGTVTVYSSDHAPSIYNHPMGKKKGLADGKMDFSAVPNGLPGLETRVPLLWCYGVETGRISAQRFVEVACTNPAALYGMSQSKGSIDVGLDADFVIWYPKGAMKPFRLTNSMLHHRIDYTPYEGMEFTNWPRYSILRGHIVWDRDHGGLQDVRIGQFLKRGKSTMNMERVM